MSEEIIRDKQRRTAAAVLAKVEEFIAQDRLFRMDEVWEPLSIFDWWTETLSKNRLYQMRQFLKEAIKLGYTGYVCFKVGIKGCSNGMWAHTELETDDGYSPRNCPALYRSFTPAYTYWDVTDKHGNWDWVGKYSSVEARQTEYNRIKTIKQLEAYIEENRRVVRWDA